MTRSTSEEQSKQREEYAKIASKQKKRGLLVFSNKRKENKRTKKRSKKANT